MQSARIISVSCINAVALALLSGGTSVLCLLKNFSLLLRLGLALLPHIVPLDQLGLARRIGERFHLTSSSSIFASAFFASFQPLASTSFSHTLAFT